MFSQNGLSLDQAPPISVVFRFFLSGSLFGILAGIFILLTNTDIFNPSNTSAIILTHILTLGVMLSFMFAALFQMLPVIAGVTLRNPVKKANLLQYPFTLGVISLLLAFYSSSSLLFATASVLLGGSILYIVIIMIKNLLQIPNHSASSKGMLVSLLALGITVILAIYLTSSLSSVIDGSYYIQIKEAHYSFGLFGWISLLIISISFQVIEMFYVTPSYPSYVSKYLPVSILIVLLITTVSKIFLPSIWIYSDILLAVVLSLYSILTIKRLTQRKRPLTDATVWFWRLGLSSLILSMIFLIISKYTNIENISHLSHIFFASFALSIVFAMFYKIVPFLTWFHLNSQGYFTAPLMYEVIHPKTAMKHLYIHLSTIVIFVLSLFLSPLIYLAGALTIVSFSWMAYQIIHAWKLYQHTQATGEKFDMGNIN
jgi:hypothetical protein